MSFPAYKNRKDKKKDKADKADKADKLVDHSSVTVIGLSDVETSDPLGVSPVKSGSKSLDQSASSEFAELKDQWSSCFTRTEGMLAVVRVLSLVGHLISRLLKNGVSQPPPPLGRSHLGSHID